MKMYFLLKMVIFRCYLSLPEGTLSKTNIAPENRPSQKETIVFQPSIFGCELLVSERVYNIYISTYYVFSFESWNLMSFQAFCNDEKKTWNTPFYLQLYGALEPVEKKKKRLQKLGCDFDAFFS